MKPFRVLSNWIEWAHRAAAEDGQPLATRMIDYAYTTKPPRFPWRALGEFVALLLVFFACGVVW